jgi:hypothetical protein
MGSSFVDLKDVGFWTNDGVLEARLHFLVLEIDDVAAAPTWLAEAREEWQFQATNAMNGCHGLGLDSYVTSATRRARLLRLVGAALEGVRGYGERIPAEELNDGGVGGPGSRWGAPGPPTQLITQLGEAFMSLLSQVSLDPERLPGFVATVLDHDEALVLGAQRVTLHLQSGQVNAGVGRLLLPTGQAYAVGITDVWLFNGRIPDFLSPDDADKVIITLTGVAPDLLAPGVLLVQQLGIAP